jgi:Na+/phosphate symporter
MKPQYDQDIVSPPAKENQVLSGIVELVTSQSEAARDARAHQAWLWQVRLGKIVLFMTSLFLFILAITLMKNGARGLAPMVSNTFFITGPADSLGFGWLFAYLVMSGSPVAAAALTFFDAGVLDEIATFAMITGSRLGASLIVLIIGFLYILRGREKTASLSMGLLSLTVTGTTYFPGLFLGVLLLQSGTLDFIQLQSGAVLHSIIDWIFDPIASLVTSLLSDWLVFMVGLGIIMISFNLFDRCLPQVTLKESKVGWMSRLIYRPWVMFALGALVTLISMSVSLSLSILVPLSARGYVRRENVIPYIMGANITTFIDTLLAAVLLNNPRAFTVVFVEMFTITVISTFILMTVYHPYHQGMIRFEAWMSSRDRNLILFMIVILIIPVILLLN